jgi:hypothetical protein
MASRECARGRSTARPVSSARASRSASRAARSTGSRTAAASTRSSSRSPPPAAGPAYFQDVAQVLAAAAGGPPDLAATGEVMRRHGLTPAQTSRDLTVQTIRLDPAAKASLLHEKGASPRRPLPIARGTSSGSRAYVGLDRWIPQAASLLGLRLSGARRPAGEFITWREYPVGAWFDCGPAAIA